MQISVLASRAIKKTLKVKNLQTVALQVIIILQVNNSTAELAEATLIL